MIKSRFKKIKAYARLTRYDEHYGAVIFVISIGLFLVKPFGAIEALLLITAGLLYTSFAFMFNDIEDADDDSKDKLKRKSNMVSNGSLDKNEAYFVSFIFAFLSMLIYFLLGPTQLFWGMIALLLGLFYSWRKIRLKSLPIIDLLSHGFGVSLGFIISISLYPERIAPFQIILIGGALFLSSVLGDMRNEIRDHDVDRSTGLNNTAKFINLLPFRKYLNHAEIAVLSVIVVYMLLNTSLMATSLIFIVVVATAIHYLKTSSLNNLVLDYPQRHISFTLIALILLLS